MSFIESYYTYIEISTLTHFDLSKATAYCTHIL